MTPDPYQKSGRAQEPQTWNRYTYTRGDPVNRFDPNGLDDFLEAPPDGGSGGGGCFIVGFDPVYGDPVCADGTGLLQQLPEEPVPQVDCQLALTAEVNTLLTSKGSPLAAYSSWFVAVGLMDDIDPRLIVAIAGAESGYGTSNVAKIDDNPFGIVHRSAGKYVPVKYSNFGESITAEGNILDGQIYGKNNNTVNKLYSGQKGAYCVDSPGFPCSNGAKNVTSILSGLGGDPNNLAFPCPQ